MRLFTLMLALFACSCGPGPQTFDLGHTYSTGSSVTESFVPGVNDSKSADFDTVSVRGRDGQALAVIDDVVVTLHREGGACTSTITGAVSSGGWQTDNTEFQQAHGQKVFVRLRNANDASFSYTWPVAEADVDCQTSGFIIDTPRTPIACDVLELATRAEIVFQPFPWTSCPRQP